MRTARSQLDGRAAAAVELDPAPGPGAYSLRLADIDERIATQGVQLTEIHALLVRVERDTAVTGKTIGDLWASIRRHPLLSKFLKEN